MRRLGIIVIATKFGLDTRTKEGMLMAQQTLSMAQWDNYRTIFEDLMEMYLFDIQSVNIVSRIKDFTSVHSMCSNITGMGSASASSK